MAGRPLDPRNDASQTATRVLAKEHSTNFGCVGKLVTPGDCKSPAPGTVGSTPTASTRTDPAYVARSIYTVDGSG